MKKLREKTHAEDFWEDGQKARNINEEISQLTNTIKKWEGLKRDIDDLATLAEEMESKKIKQPYQDLKTKFEQEKINLYLSGKYDKRDVFLSLRAVAGGVDAEDWTKMLARMYEKFSEKQNWSFETISSHYGNQEGIKRATYKIEGRKVYGWLKKEQGVHRLIRISPYSSEDQRHTSFALVEIIPEIEVPSVKIKENDLKIDTYKASGPGGQHVNKRETAVRITHLPTGLKVSAQNERSQARNKKEAMKILKSKLTSYREKIATKKKESLESKIEPEWGNQIRTYVMHPYKQVRDHRTKIKTSKVEKILDGNLECFIQEEIKLE